MKPAICNSNKRSPATPDNCPSEYWLVRVNDLSEVGEVSFDHAYILPDNSVWVWSHDESRLVLISGSEGIIEGGLPTQVHSVDGKIIVTGSGTHNVGLALSPDVLQGIDVGEVTTGEPGTDAIVTNSGTDAQAVLNFTIPRGDQGIQGERGAPGEIGPAGPQPALGTALPLAPVATAVAGTATTASRVDHRHPFPSQLATARNFNIGDATRSFNGTADATWTLADIGAAPASHVDSFPTHNRPIQVITDWDFDCYQCSRSRRKC